jgi:hypothetical protein
LTATRETWSPSSPSTSKSPAQASSPQTRPSTSTDPSRLASSVQVTPPSLAVSRAMNPRPKQSAASKASPTPRERPPVVGGLRAPCQRHADDRQGDPAQRECRRAFSDGDPVDGGNQRCGGRQGGDDAHRPAREAAVEGPQAGEVQNPRQGRPPEGCARRRRLAGESHHRHGDHEPDRLREQQHGGQGEAAALESAEEVGQAPGEARAEGQCNRDHRSNFGRADVSLERRSPGPRRAAFLRRLAAGTMGA